MTRILVTNDDGIDSPGIWALAGVAVGRGHDVVVAAPTWDSSGSGASLTAVEREGRLVVEERQRDDLPGVLAVAVEAAPAFIVRAALSGAFGPPPDAVLSGINAGANTGHAVLHSGTVGAALTAASFGLPAVAVSIAGAEPTHWETAAHVAELCLGWLIDGSEGVTLNVNVPDVGLDQLATFEPARLAPFGSVQTTVTESGAGYVKLRYEPTGADLQPGTDAALLAQGIACFTPLLGITEVMDAEVGALPRDLRR